MMFSRIVTLTVLATLLLATGFASAQGIPILDPAVGVKAGVNFSNLDISKAGTENRTGFVGGAYGQFPFSPYFTIQLEALYSQKGFTKAKLADLTDWEMKTSFMEIPLIVRAEIPMPRLKPFFYLGGSWNILTGSQVKNSDTNNEWVDNDEGLKSSSFVWVFGLGLKVNNIDIDARINHGKTNLNDDENSDLEIFDRTISLTVGYAFSL